MPEPASRLTPDQIWIGLDLGTQSARCVAVDGTGRVLAAASQPLASRRDGVRHEQDPEQWWSALSAACRAALADPAVDPRRVAGLAVDGTSGTILLADARTGSPLTPGLMYDDGRAVEQARSVNDSGAKVWHELGYGRMQPSWALPKLRWLLDQGRPSAPARLLHQPDLITWRLTGHQTAADSSHALKTGYHLVDEHWPEALGVPPDLLPEVVRPGTVLGEVCPEAEQATGIPRGTPVVAGMTDGCAAQIAAGALTPGAWNSVLGTTLVLKGMSPTLVRDPDGVVYCHRGPGGDGWLPGGASSSGAGILAQRFPGADADRLDRLTAEARRTPGDAVVYPLVSRGERFPFRSPEAEPFVLGEPASEAEDFHACLLGVAFLERLCFDYLDHLGAPVDGPLGFTGGGARNPYWCRLRADTLGRPAALPAQAESAVGMAVLAATSAGVTVRQAAAAMVRIARTVTPDRERHAQLTPRYLDFVAALHHRGWLTAEFAAHVHRKATG